MACSPKLSRAGLEDVSGLSLIMEIVEFDALSYNTGCIILVLAWTKWGI